MLQCVRIGAYGMVCSKHLNILHANKHHPAGYCQATARLLPGYCQPLHWLLVEAFN